VRPLKIISGGQTGVDRAAWDVAIELGLDWGGWVPKGRKAEDGRIPDRYDRCVEHESAGWLPRTYANIDDARLTLIVAPSAPFEGGTARTYRYARRHCKPVECSIAPRPSHVDWLRALIDRFARRGPLTLNVAGPRASKWPDADRVTKALLREALR
jgi:hypothetical protein